MISKSHYWKKDLLLKKSKLGKSLSKKKWTDDAKAKIEQIIQIGFFSIQKILDSKLVTNQRLKSRVLLREFEPKTKAENRILFLEFEKLYNLTHYKEKEHDILFLCHQFTSSLVFKLEFNKSDNLLKGVFVTSDHQKNKALYWINMGVIIELFEAIGNDPM